VSSKGLPLESSALIKSFRDPAGHHARTLDNITLSAGAGEFVVILGPSGCGKSTLLRCLSGFETVDDGVIRIGGEEVRDVPESVAVVFQDYSKSLFPWLTLEKNVTFGLRGRKKELAEQARDALHHVGLDGYAQHYPWQVSGGMQQRTAIARALARSARMIILDEPFAAVDALTRMKLEDTFLGLWHEFGFTTVFVTHDVDEAIYLADRVVVLSPRPASIVADLTVDLPRPRQQVTTRAQERFQELRGRALACLGIEAPSEGVPSTGLHSAYPADPAQR
jgi:NitT/TauT family transport system ATP-binding protein